MAATLVFFDHSGDIIHINISTYVGIEPTNVACAPSTATPDVLNHYTIEASPKEVRVHEYKGQGGMEKSVPRITDWHHEASRQTVIMRDRFFYPILTQKMDSFSCSPLNTLFLLGKHEKYFQKILNMLKNNFLVMFNYLLLCCFNPFPASHRYCCLLSNLLMFLGSHYCKQYGPR